MTTNRKHLVFQFRVNSDERRMIQILAKHLRRSQSDSLRTILEKAYQEIENTVLMEEERNTESNTARI